MLRLVRDSSSAHLAVWELDLPALLRVLAGGAPAVPATNPEILALEAMPAEPLWCVSPTSFLWSLHFSAKASGVLRSGSGPRKIHMASPLTLIQHLAKKSTRATAA